MINMKCPDCNEELLDLKTAYNNSNPDPSKDYDDLKNAKTLALIANDNRRYYCNNCDLGFTEEDL